MIKGILKLLSILFMVTPLQTTIGDDITKNVIEVKRSENTEMFTIEYETNSEEIFSTIDNLANSVKKVVTDVEMLTKIVEERTNDLKTYFSNLVYIPEKAKLGTIITFGVGENSFLTLSFVSINETGELIVPNEDGIYSFEVKGDTKLFLNFEINSNLLLKEFVNIPKDKWEELLTIENILLLVQFLLTTLFSSGFFVALYKTKKIKAQTTEEISKAVDFVVSDSVKQSVDKFLSSLFKETVENISKKTDGIAETTKVMARCFALSQEGTPESRLAIMEELTKLKTYEAELSEKIKKIINDTIAKNNQIQEEKVKALEEIKEANEKIIVETVEEGQDYGIL